MFVRSYQKGNFLIAPFAICGNLSKNEKKVLTKHKTYDTINELIQMSEKLKQFNDSGLTKVFEKR